MARRLTSSIRLNATAHRHTVRAPDPYGANKPFHPQSVRVLMSGPEEEYCVSHSQWLPRRLEGLQAYC